MKKNILFYGIISGVLVSAWMAISMIMMHNNPNAEMGTGSMIIGFLSMIVAFSFIYVAVKKSRDGELGGSISFGKAFRMGLFIAFIASTCYVITWALLYNFVMPDFMEVYSKQMIKAAEKSADPEKFQAKIAEMEKYKEMYKNPALFTVFTYIEILPVGIIVALITALILKKNPAVQSA